MDWSRIRRAFHIGSFRPDPEREVDEELRFHFERTMEELVEGGMSPDEARREAERRFGDVAAYRADLEERERARVPGALTRWAGAVGEAATYALRRIRRKPGFSAAVIATLALGIGANLAMFRIVDRLMLSPPEHIENADQIRKLTVTATALGRRSTGDDFAFADLEDLSRVGAFDESAAYRRGRGILGSGVGAEAIRFEAVSSSHLPLLGVTASYGRLFSPEDHRPGAPPTALLSHELWSGRFGSDPDILGSTLEIDGVGYTVIGVAPPGFTGVDVRAADVWLPMDAQMTAQYDGDRSWRTNRNYVGIQIVARLAEGVSDEAAAAEATTAIVAAYDEESRRPEQDIRLDVIPLVASADPFAGDEIDVALWLGGVSFLVLLIACANVANLFLARSLRGSRELALRAALGAGRWRLVGHMVVEAGILCLVGGGVAMVLASWGGSALQRLLLPDVSFAGAGGLLDGRLVSFTGLAVAFATLVVAAVPAVQWSRPGLAAILKSGGERAAAPRTRSQAGLLVVQAALSVVLLTGAGVFVRSLSNVESIDLGFDPEGLAMVDLDLAGDAFVLPQGPDAGELTWPPTEGARIHEEAARRLAMIPELRGVSLASPAPFTWTIVMPFGVPGRESLDIQTLDGPFPVSVEPGYFDLMDIEIVRGRRLAPADDTPDAAPVTVLNEALAERIWPGEDALGRCVRIGREGAPCATVVGIASDSHRASLLEEEPPFIYYVPIRRLLVGTVNPTIVVRAGASSAGGWDDVPGAIRAATLTASSNIRFTRVMPFTDLATPELRPWRLGATVFSAFGLLALLVSAVGIYSVLAFDVAGRAREMGIRSALGARGATLLGLVARQSTLLVGGGIVLGFAVVLLGGSRLDPLLYRTSPTDPEILAGVAITLGVVAVAASVVPALRALRVDPMTVMRAE